MNIREPNESNHFSRTRKRLLFGIAAFSVVLAVLAIYLFQAERHTSSMRSFQSLETTSRQILTIMAAHFSVHDRYPADKEELHETIAVNEQALATKLQESQIGTDYKPTDSGKTFLLTLWQKDRPKFRYICDETHACNWQPHLPYP